MSKCLILVLASLFLPTSSAHAATFTDWTELNPTGAGSQYWTASASSYDGSVMYAAARSGFIYKSTDFGSTWNRLANSGARYWGELATNDSGTIVYGAPSSYDYIYRSLDSGATWDTCTAAGSESWMGLDTSATGTIVIASNQSSNKIVISRDSGATWPTTPAALTGTANIGTNPKSISMSGDGNKFAFQSNEGTYTASYSGSVWTVSAYKNVVSSSGSLYTKVVSISRDGSRIVTAGSSDKIHFTSDFGTTWETATAHSASRTIACLSISGDGSRIGLCDSNGPSYYATFNNGVLSTWTSSVVPSNGFWTSLTSSFTGTYWVGTMENSSRSSHGIQVSADSLVNISVKRPPDGYSTITKIEASADGSRIMAINLWGDVWLSSDSGSNWTVANLPSLTYPINCIAISDDGQKMSIGTDSKFYISTNGGSTFTAATAAPFTTSQKVSGCSISGDGFVIAVLLATSGVYVTNNDGTSFTSKLVNPFKGSSYTWTSIAMSSDGTKFALGASAAFAIARSIDSGATWDTTTAPIATYYSLKSSSDGSALIAFSSSATQPIISRNWGNSWSNISTTITKNFNDGFAVSNDGSLIVAGNAFSNYPLYQSTDFGVTFTAIPGSQIGPQYGIKITKNRNFLLSATLGRRMLRTTIVPPTLANFSALSLSTSNIAFRSQVTLSATISNSGADGKVTFFANGKKIAGCVKVRTTSLVATCSWKPATRGAVTLSAISYPTDSNFLSGSTSLPVVVANRTGNR
jgi:hypothetical protein